MQPSGQPQHLLPESSRCSHVASRPLPSVPQPITPLIIIWALVFLPKETVHPLRGLPLPSVIPVHHTCLTHHIKSMMKRGRQAGGWTWRSTHRPGSLLKQGLGAASADGKFSNPMIARASINGGESLSREIQLNIRISSDLALHSAINTVSILSSQHLGLLCLPLSDRC